MTEVELTGEEEPQAARWVQGKAKRGVCVCELKLEERTSRKKAQVFGCAVCEQRTLWMLKFTQSSSFAVCVCVCVSGLLVAIQMALCVCMCVREKMRKESDRRCVGPTTLIKTAHLHPTILHSSVFSPSPSVQLARRHVRHFKAVKTTEIRKR